jgi:hypothetical protein
MPVRTPAPLQIEESLPFIRGRRSPNLKDAGYDHSVTACFECCRREARARRAPPDRKARKHPTRSRPPAPAGCRPRRARRRGSCSASRRRTSPFLQRRVGSELGSRQIMTLPAMTTFHIRRLTSRLQAVSAVARPGGLGFAPNGREQRLLMPRQSWRAVVMPHFLEAGDIIAPSIQTEEASLAIVVKALLDLRRTAHRAASTFGTVVKAR